MDLAAQNERGRMGG